MLQIVERAKLRLQKAVIRLYSSGMPMPSLSSLRDPVMQTTETIQSRIEEGAQYLLSHLVQGGVQSARFLLREAPSFMLLTDSSSLSPMPSHPPC